MLRVIQWAKREFLHVLPAFIFFLAAFSLICFTERSLLKRGGVQFSYWTIFIAAALVAKIVLVLDHLRFMKLFERKPLIWNVIWKTVVYAIAVFLLRFSIRLAPFLADRESWGAEFTQFLDTVDWAVFWAVQSWYYTLFFVFNLSREFVLVIGPEKTRRIFFGW
jgi:hypothetical protein